jgi:hypothetical protein
LNLDFGRFVLYLPGMSKIELNHARVKSQADENPESVQRAGLEISDIFHVFEYFRPLMPRQP